MYTQYKETFSIDLFNLYVDLLGVLIWQASYMNNKSGEKVALHLSYGKMIQLDEGFYEGCHLSTPRIDTYPRGKVCVGMMNLQSLAPILMYVCFSWTTHWMCSI